MIRILVLACFLLLSSSVQAEPYFIYSLEELAEKSSYITKTTFQCRDGDNYIFVTDTSDTIVIDRGQMIYFYNSPAQKNYNYIEEPDPCNLYHGIWQSEFCFLFIEKMDAYKNARLVSSGIKIIKENEVYSQKYGRPSNFFRLDEHISLRDLISVENKMWK